MEWGPTGLISDVYVTSGRQRAPEGVNTRQVSRVHYWLLVFGIRVLTNEREQGPMMLANLHLCIGRDTGRQGFTNGVDVAVYTGGV